MAAAVTLEHVSKYLSGRQILRNVSFAVERGDIFGCLGPNGAGKTTTIRIILGLLRAADGQIRVLGSDPGDERVRRRVGFVLETDGLYDNLSARDNLAYYGRLYGVGNIAGRVETVLDTAGLSDRALDKVSTYSKGMRQRLALARAILHEPELLVLDEPTSGLDPGGQLEVRRTLLDLARTEGKTIFVSSHNLDEMQRLCNRIVLIHGGEIKLYGELESLARGSGRKGVTVETSAPLPAELVAELTRATGATVESQDGSVIEVSGDPTFQAPAVVAFLVGRGVGVEQVTKRQDSLEELYLRIEAEVEGDGDGRRRRRRRGGRRRRPKGGRAMSDALSKAWIIARKDFGEVFFSRSTYAYIPVMLLMSSYFFFSYFGLIGQLEDQNASAETVYLASRVYLTNIAYLIPILYSLFATNMGSAQLLIEKSKRSLESLLVTPVSVRTVWIGKSLGAAMVGVVFGLSLSVFAYLVISLAEVLPQTHRYIAPEGLAFLSGLVLVPAIIFLVAALLAYVQMIATNARVANLANVATLLVVWGVLFFASVYLPLKGISIGYYPLIFVGLILLLAGGCLLCSRALSKERVVLSSKG